MAYSAISTLSDSNPLTHTHLNTVQGDVDFLYDIVHRSNWPCPSIHRDDTGGWDEDDHIYMFRHRLQYLIFAMENVTGTVDQVRVFYNGHKVYGDESPSTPLLDSIDLHDITSWPNYLGSWAVSTNYHEDTDGDGEIVTNGGSYYKCILGHTSSAGDQPGVGGSWTTYWTEIAIPSLGGWYEAYVYMQFDTGTGEMALDYLYEDF